MSDLVEFGEKAVDEVSGEGWAKSLLMLMDLLHDKVSQLFYLGKNRVLLSRQALHQPGENVVHLWENNSGSEGCTVPWSPLFSLHSQLDPHSTCPQGLLPNCSAVEIMLSRRRKLSSL